MRLHEQVPEWPAWTAPAAVVGGYLAGVPLSVLVAVALAAAGFEGDDLSPGVVLALVVALAAGFIGVAVALA